MDGPTITINMDASCTQCGKRGITGSGLCLECATKALLERKDTMLDNVSFDGVVATTSTNWPKHETRIGVSARYEDCAESEADTLGEIMRDETAVDVSICDKESTGEIIEFRGTVEGVRTDWAKKETAVTFSVTTSEKFDSKSSVLGVWGERHLVVTIRIVPAQERLL